MRLAEWSSLMSSSEREESLERAGQRVLRNPGKSVAVLLLVAFFVEFLQMWPQWIPGGHALGEVLRNLAYAIAAALLFHWIVVKIPEERRQRAAHESHAMAFKTLIVSGIGSLGQYRALLQLMSEMTGEKLAELDAHDRASVWAVAEETQRKFPGFLAQGSDHFALLHSAIMSVQVSLDGVAASLSFFHPEVARALGSFPAATGLQQLQIPPHDADLDLRMNRSAHITWELLQGARRLFAALDEHAPYLDLKIDAMTSHITVNGKVYSGHMSRCDLTGG